MRLMKSKTSLLYRAYPVGLLIVQPSGSEMHFTTRRASASTVRTRFAALPWLLSFVIAKYDMHNSSIDFRVCQEMTFSFSRRIQCIISRKEINTILIHTDAFSFRMFGQHSMQTLRKPQFELSRIFLRTRWLRNRKFFLQCRSDPLFLCILRISKHRLYRFTASDASRKLRKRHDEPALIFIFQNLHAIRQRHIFFNRFHLNHSHFPRLFSPSPRKLFLSAHASGSLSAHSLAF